MAGIYSDCGTREIITLRVHGRSVVQAWPENALELVAHKLLENVDLGEREKQETVNICKQFHMSNAKLSEE